MILTKAYKDYAAKLKRYAFFKLNNPILVQELVQDTFLKAWQYLLKGGRIDKMQAFLYHVLNDLIIDEYRKRKPVSLETLSEQGFEPGVNEVPRLINRLDGKKIITLVKQLPQKYRKAITMRYLYDMTLEEMSYVNGQSKNTNAVQVRRGLKMIKSLSRKKNRGKK